MISIKLTRIINQLLNLINQEKKNEKNGKNEIIK